MLEVGEPDVLPTNDKTGAAPKSHNQRRSKALAIAIVTLLAMELGARALSPYFGSAVIGEYPLVSQKAEQMRKLAASSCTQVVVVGASGSLRGFDPARFDPIAGVSSYNASLPGLSHDDMNRWMLNYIEPIMHPKVVVIAANVSLLAEIDVVKRATVRAIPVPADQKGVLGEARSWLARHSELFNHRTEILDPQQLWAAIGNFIKKKTPDPFGEAGYEIDQNGYSASTSRSDLLDAREAGTALPSGAGYLRPIFHDSRAELVKGIQSLKSRGVLPIVVLAPASAEFQQLSYIEYGSGFIGPRQFSTAVADLAKRSGVPFYDFTDADQDPTHYEGPSHLNDKGAAQFSKVLASTVVADPRFESVVQSGCGGDQ